MTKRYVPTTSAYLHQDSGLRMAWHAAQLITHDKQVGFALMQRNIKLPGGCHKGELTKLGQQQARDVGEWLRQRYVQDLSFLPAQYEVGCIDSPTICITLILPVHQATCVTFRGRYISNPAAACAKCSLHIRVAKRRAQLAVSNAPLCSRS